MTKKKVHCGEFFFFKKIYTICGEETKKKDSTKESLACDMERERERDYAFLLFSRIEIETER